MCLLLDLILNQLSWLDNLGRKTRSNKNEKLENFLTELQRLTIVHESDQNGSYYRFTSGAQSREEEGADDKGKKDTKAKDVKTKKDEKEAKHPDTSKGKNKAQEGGAAADGDKTLSDDHGQSAAEEKQRREDERGEGPHMTDDSGSSSENTIVDRHD
jgi:H+-transporting ATPase